MFGVLVVYDPLRVADPPLPTPVEGTSCALPSRASPARIASLARAPLRFAKGAWPPGPSPGHTPAF